MDDTKRKPSLIDEVTTAAETLALEAMPIIASVAQETGLGAELPEDTPAEDTKKDSPTSSDPNDTPPHVTK